MKIVIQRVSKASVVSDGVLTGAIGPGLVLFVGIENGDAPRQVEQLAGRVLKLRLFPSMKDGSKPWASSVVDNRYGLLVVSQFTLFALFKKLKPDFHRAMKSAEAEVLFASFVAQCRAGLGCPEAVATGVFGSMMRVDLVNDGPVTVELVELGDGEGRALEGAEEAETRPSPAGCRLGPAEEEHLARHSYLGGHRPTRRDAEVFQQLLVPGVAWPSAPNLRRWAWHMDSFTWAERSAWTT